MGALSRYPSRRQFQSGPMQLLFEMRALETLGGAGAFGCLGLVWVLGCSAAQRPVIELSRPVADSMNAIFARSTEHWDELEDLSQLEKMLGTVRPTQKEYLGCLTGSHAGDTVRVRSEERRVGNACELG